MTIALVLWLSLTSVAAIAAQGPASPVAPPPGTPVAAPAPSAAPAEYVLQRGDDLEIRVHNIVELNQVAKVRPDGKISLLLLDEMSVTGMTAASLSKLLSEKYSEHYRNPRVTVVVRSFSDQQVFVGGEVNTPKMLVLNGKMTLSGALMSAGGLKNSAKTGQVVLLRDSGKGNALVSRVDVKALLKKGGVDPELRPFDVVFVPKSRIATINQVMEQFVRNNMPLTIGFGFSYLLGQQALFQ